VPTFKYTAANFHVVNFDFPIENLTGLLQGQFGTIRSRKPDSSLNSAKNTYKVTKLLQKFTKLPTLTQSVFETTLLA